ncbi:MAG: hypothetical protein Kow0025_15700 [Thermodesulfovibrionales bacterium]
MKRILLLMAVILAVGVIPLAAFAEGRGGGGMGGGPETGRRGGMGGSPVDEIGGEGRGPAMREMERVRLSERQKEHFRSARQTAERARSHAGSLAAAARGQGFSRAEGVGMRDALRQEFRAMEESHSRFMEGLGPEGRDALRSNERSIERERNEIRQRMRALDMELSKPEPDRDRVAEQAREIERRMSGWQEQYRAMESAMERE